MKTTYKDVEIEYNEDKNIWEFELRGRSRSAESLLKAKEAIDKPVVNKEKSKFVPMRAFLIESYRDDAFPIVTITSIEEPRAKGESVGCWINNSGKEKNYQHNLLEITPYNENLIKEVKENCAKIKQLEERNKDIKNNLLIRIKLPENEV